MRNYWPIVVVVALVLALLATIACCVLTGLFTLPATSRITGSTTPVTRVLDLTGFSGVTASSAFQIEIQQSSAYKVELIVSENVIDYVVAEIRNGKLTLGLKPGRSYNRVQLSARISMPELNSLGLSGAARATLLGEWATQELALDLSGSSYAEGAFEASELALQLSGSSRVKLEGSTDVLRAEASGASALDLDNLRAQDAVIQLSGASNGTVDVYDNLDVSLSGASRLTYGGDPKLGRVETSGSSRLLRR